METVFVFLFLLSTSFGTPERLGVFLPQDLAWVANSGTYGAK